MFNIKKFLNGLRILPKTTLESDSKGEIEVRDSDGRLAYHDGTTRDIIVSQSSTDTLTNKDIDGDNNTITDLSLSSLKVEAGDANKFLERDGSGNVISGKAVPTGDVVGNSDSQTLTNKDINADNNTISNLEVDNLKAGVLDTDLSAVSATDNTIPSAKATKAYVDSQIQSKDEASEITFDDTNLNVTGTNLQLAVDDVANSAAAAQATADGKADQDLNNLTSPTSVNQHLIPQDGTQTLGIAGASADSWDTTYTKEVVIDNGLDTEILHIVGGGIINGEAGGATIEMQDGGTNDDFVIGTIDQTAGQTGKLILTSGESAAGFHTGIVRLESGDATGTGNSGNVEIKAGASTGGTRGSVTLDAAENGVKLVNQPTGADITSVATTGYVDTAVTGAGYADQDLGNLTSPTAINQHLLPDGDTTRNLGADGSAYGQLFVTQVKPGTGNLLYLQSGNGTTNLDLRDGFTYFLKTLDGSNLYGVDNTTKVQSAEFEIGDNVGNITAPFGNRIEMATTAQAADTDNITLITGAASGASGTSGQLNLRTGDTTATAGDSGDILLLTGTSSNGNRGNITLSTDADQALLAAQPTGGTDLAIATTKYVNDNVGTSLFIETDLGASGYGMHTPDETTTATKHAQFYSGDVTDAGATVNTGTVTLGSGANSGTGAAGSGNNLIYTGTTVGTSDSGYIDIYTGNTTGATTTSGNTYFRSGTSAFASGTVAMYSGDVSNTAATTGTASVHSGITTVGNTGHVYLYSGDTSDAGIVKTTGNVEIRSGNAASASNGISGDISLTIGTAVNKGDIKLKDGSEGTIGHVWTSTGVDGEGTWAAPDGAGANETLSNLTSPTDINQDLLPNDASKNLGGDGTVNNGWSHVYTQNVYAPSSNALALRTRDQATTSSGGLSVGTGTNGGAALTGSTSIFSGFASGTNGSGWLNLYTGNATGGATGSGKVWMRTGAGTNAISGNVEIETGNTGSTSGSSGDILLTTGNATSGVGGDSGSIVLETGTSTAGTRGGISLKDGSEGTIGHVWTSTGVNGEGEWSAAGASGANTSLSNLITTSVNQDLIPAVNSGQSLGQTSKRWSQLYVGSIQMITGGSTQVLQVSSGGLTPSGINCQPLYAQLGGATQALGFNTANKSAGSNNIQIETGNASAGNSGSIDIQTGTASGTRGTITLDTAADGVVLANQPTGGTALAVATTQYVDNAVAYQAAFTIPALDIDWSNASDVYFKSISANTTFTWSNTTDGQTIIVNIQNTDASNHTVDFPTTNVYWPGGTSTVTVDANSFTVVTFIKVGSNFMANAVNGLL